METPRKRTNSALEVLGGQLRDRLGAAGRRGAIVRVWRGSVRPWRPDVAATQDRGGAAVAAGEDLETLSRLLGITAATLSKRPVRGALRG